MNIEEFTKEDLLEVQWIDIIAWSGWTKVTENTPVVCKSYGFTLEIKESDGKKSVTISGTVAGSNGSSEFNQHITIPVDCIISVRKINKE